MKRPAQLPQRTCVACRQTRAKGELLRIVRTPQGEVVVDVKGKEAGRGAYVCRQERCAEQAVKQRKLARALGVSVGAELLAAIQERLAEVSERT